MTPLVMLGAATGALLAQVVTVVIGFFAMLWILQKFAWGPIVTMIDERRDTIAREFDTIEKKQGNLDSQIKDYEERLRQIDQEARERMNKAVDEGRKAAEEVKAAAAAEVAQLREKAERDVRLEMEKARVTLRDEVVSMTIAATEKLLKTELNDERHRQLVGSFVSELGNG